MENTRREFLALAGISLTALTGLSQITGCGGITRKDIRGDKVPASDIVTPEEYMLLFYATLAPSGHNTQPWTVTVERPGQWLIGSSRERWLPHVDPENRELLLSLGAFLENLDQASRVLGHQVSIEPLARSGMDNPVARVRLRRNKATAGQDILEAIKNRRTLRNGLSKSDLKGTDLKALFRDIPGINYISNGSPKGKYLQEGTIEANRRQAWREPAQRELARWIRWSDAEAEEHRNGLTPASMEIGGFTGWMVRTFFDQESVLGKSFREKTVSLVREQTRDCGGWILLTTPDSRAASLIEAGRRFQRLFLRVRDRGVALHPMTQMLEESPWRESSAGSLGSGSPLQFIIRTGYVSRYGSPVSLRMPVTRILKSRIPGRVRV